jgi:hypothetical protein
MTNAIDYINVLLDVILLIALVWMVMVALRGLGGVIGSAINLVTIGALILGFEHISRRLPFDYLDWNANILELFHRVIAFIGFFLLAFGFRKIRIMTMDMKKQMERK